MLQHVFHSSQTLLPGVRGRDLVPVRLVSLSLHAAEEPVLQEMQNPEVTPPVRVTDFMKTTSFMLVCRKSTHCDWVGVLDSDSMTVVFKHAADTHRPELAQVCVCGLCVC